MTPAQAISDPIKVVWTTGQSGAYYGANGTAQNSITPATPNPTVPASITITPSAGQGNSVCQGAAKQTYSGTFELGYCTAVTVTVTPQPYVPLGQGAQDEAISPTPTAAKPPNLSTTAPATFAVTPNESSFTLGAEFLSGDAKTYSTNTTLPATRRVDAVTVTAPPLPSIATAIVAGKNSTACGSNAAPDANATLAVGQCSALNVTLTPPNGGPALASGDTVTVTSTDAEGAQTTTTASLSTARHRWR